MDSLKEKIIEWIKSYFNSFKDYSACIAIKDEFSLLSVALCKEALGKDKVFCVEFLDKEEHIHPKMIDECCKMEICIKECDMNERIYQFNNYLNEIKERLKIAALADIAEKNNAKICSSLILADKVVGNFVLFGMHAGDFNAIGNCSYSKLIKLAKELNFSAEIINNLENKSYMTIYDKFTYKEIDTMFTYYLANSTYAKIYPKTFMKSLTDRQILAYDEYKKSKEKRLIVDIPTFFYYKVDMI